MDSDSSIDILKEVNGEGRKFPHSLCFNYSKSHKTSLSDDHHHQFNSCVQRLDLLMLDTHIFI